ncbi:hypothetical protein [Chengkuizengella marina]|uniref:Uncharacterized protein n=1 Tax=Chengkuizengella marina TaxID=2507566 RepID=A0A6N9Q0R0_9BACL|nr:hypothetical protein [Chengkuizengella marina]NBI28323.1 hypothetical protein [Chengkuizengella marina]
MEIIGYGKVTQSGEREMIVRTTVGEIRLLTNNPSDYSKSLNIGDEIEVSKKYLMFNIIQRSGNAIIHALDNHRNAIIDSGLVDVKKGDIDGNKPS